MSSKENKSKKVVNSLKRSATAEYLVNISNCSSNYNLKRFKSNSNCYSIFDSINLRLYVFY